MKKHLEKALIVKNEKITASICHLVLKAPEIAAEARPGQFMMVRINEGFDPMLRRPFSFYGIHREEGLVEVAYKIVGKGTGYLSGKRPGETLDLLGPLGNGFRLPPRDASSIWFMAGGIGIAALVPCIKEVKHQTPQATVVLFYGARIAADLFSVKELEKMCDEVRCSTDDGSFGFCGSALGCAVDTFESCQEKPSYVYACGPPVMLKHAAQWVMDLKIPSQFCLESMMGCGLGACLGCALPRRTKSSPLEPSYIHVCFEGPVFSPEVVQWSKL